MSSIIHSSASQYSIKKTIDEYYKQFRVVNDPKNKGELTSFVDYFLQILIKSLEDVNQTIDDGLVKLNYTLNLLPDYFEENEKDQRVIQVLNALVQNTLFGEIGLSVQDIVNLTGIGQSKVRSALSLLESKNLVLSKKWSKKMIYDANLSVLDSK